MREVLLVFAVLTLACDHAPDARPVSPPYDAIETCQHNVCNGEAVSITCTSRDCQCRCRCDVLRGIGSPDRGTHYYAPSKGKPDCAEVFYRWGDSPWR